MIAAEKALYEQAEALLAALNAQYAVTYVGNKVAILDTEARDEAGRRMLRILSRADFLTSVENRSAPDSKKRAGTWWLTHAKRRHFEGIVFAPGEEVQRYFNIWQGFPVVPHEGDCHKFWDFVFDVICAGSQELYVYVRQWLAHLFQMPAVLPQTALVLRGLQGTGKNFFTDTIGHLVGQHYLGVTHMSQVTGRFNGHLANVLLLNANEAVWGGNKAEEGALKAMITEPHVAMEFKGKDVVRVANYKRVIVCSNHDWAVPQDADDRRFLILDVDAAHKEDSPYFASIKEQLDGGGYEAIMYELLHEDIKSFNPRQLPATAGSLDIKLRSGTPVLRWLFECLNMGINSGFGTNSLHAVPEWKTVVAKAELHESYVTFCRREHAPHTDSQSALTYALRRVLADLPDSKPGSDGQRVRCLRFPPLEQCRARFEEYVKLPGLIEWDAV